jgi:hypothetical protein
MKFDIEGATIEQGGIVKIRKALDELAKDPHAPREVTVKFSLHIHNDFPLIVYKGKESRSVADEKELEAAREDGFGEYDHEAFTASE